MSTAQQHRHQPATEDPAHAEQHQHAAFAAAPPTDGAATVAAPPPTTGSSTAATTTAATSAGRDANSRPSIALSQNLVALYKQVNELYFKRKRLEGPGPKYNHGYDDREGHYIVIAGEEILGRYCVQEVLGKGSFGTVVKCHDAKRQEAVALKITRNGSNFRHQAKMEIDIVLKLNGNPELQESVVRLLKVFDWQGHLVLAFELLSYNLYQLISCTKFNGVSLDLTRKFALQILHVLQALENHTPSIIHCDLKPENILLKSANRSSVRVIDFGSACYANRRVYRYIQSRFYRSPEVILNLDYGTAIDRWSLGCMLVELHTGQALFDGKTEAAQLTRFEGLLGPLPEWMVSSSPKRRNFYEDDAPTLKAPPQERHMRSLHGIVGTNHGGPSGRREGQAGHEPQVYAHFVDFVEKLLRYNPAERLSVAAALAHPFMYSGTSSSRNDQPQAGPNPVPAQHQQAVAAAAQQQQQVEGGASGGGGGAA